MYEIRLLGEFSAAHQLRLADGKLEPLHGHNWVVEVELEGPALDGIGVLADFTVLQPRLQRITGSLHDTSLNDHPAFAGGNPSTEAVAKYVYEQIAPEVPKGVRVSRVRIWETRTCAAAYVP